MLVLTRRVGEALRIGSDVSVTILATRGRQVRVGITAPKTLMVYRTELYERLRREQGHGQGSRLADSSERRRMRAIP